VNRWIVAAITIVLGVVPATFLLLSVASFAWLALTGPPANLKPAMSQPFADIYTALLALGAAVGYVCLLIAAFRPVGPRVLIGLIVGIVASSYAIRLGWNLVPSAMLRWPSLYLLVSPSIVAVCHVGFSLYRQRAARSSSTELA
jgi:hypothetical protein